MLVPAKAVRVCETGEDEQPETGIEMGTVLWMAPVFETARAEATEAFTPEAEGPGAGGTTSERWVFASVAATAAVSFEWEVVSGEFEFAGCGLTTAIRYLA
ncbi:MAG: hypothetical protein K2Y26_01570 [Gemmatimonadaceae bacterium]|nr:hypothetical protein [Gemmatimonadaceae bacterium]